MTGIKQAEKFLTPKPIFGILGLFFGTNQPKENLLKTLIFTSARSIEEKIFPDPPPWGEEGPASGLSPVSSKMASQ